MVQAGDMVQVLSWDELYAEYGLGKGVLRLRTHGDWTEEVFRRFENRMGLVIGLEDDFYHIYIEGFPESVDLYFSKEAFKKV